ncbi:FAST kinase domain-containing protein 5, mitochondrial [Lucilia sericata]|uniref:FAST kinase domain-containing protein 5, mitochondrial n=1 Tax=Lucilia sericata TaxID=13632 RepID=UPI0018A7F071|nr:FAST kinase domain-containing protein 5, mitochondrial [Lucilia sericata]
MLRNIAKSVLLNNTKNLYKLKPQKCLPQTNKFFHAAAALKAKLFMDRENMHAHQVLESSLKTYQILEEYKDIVPASSLSADILKPNVENVSIQQLFDSFKFLCCYCQQSNTLISQPQFNSFVSLYCDKIHLLSDEQLKDSLRLLAVLPPEHSVRSANFVELWNTLDIECCRRIEIWKTDDLLLVCDAWYKLNLARICEYVWEALRKLGRKVIKMPPNQLVQTMFLCNIMRRSVFDMFDFEVNLAKCANEMTMAELGVMSMGFFKTQTPIRNQELLKYFYQRLMDELHTVDDITFVSILKVLRYSSKLPQADIMMQLLDKICKEKLDSMNLLTCLHVALLGCELQCCHDEIIEKIMHKFYDQLDTTRLKDLERISLVIALFNIHTPSKIEEQLCEKILQSLQGRIEEILRHPKCFTNCLHFLTLRGYYDKEMLSTTLERKFLRHAVGSNLAMSREIFHLDTFVKVNLLEEGYEGAQLLDKVRKTMGKMLTHYIPERNSKYKLNATDNILLQIKEITDTILPNNQLKHILPNYDRSDVVICYDRKQKKSLEISKDCPENYSGIILTRDLLLGANNHKEVDTIAVIVAGWNNVVRGKNRHTGLFDMKLKQLEILGHKYVVFYWHEWRELETHQDRVQFVKRRLSSVINL